ncbi:MAG: hypothetical protein EXR81_06610 [Gammaproteobacteria bacterium]|nr:hypothetical protein [Gammaproteobacteria bacterium]
MPYIYVIDITSPSSQVTHLQETFEDGALVQKISAWICTEIETPERLSAQAKIYPLGEGSSELAIIFERGKLINYHNFLIFNGDAWIPLKEAVLLYENTKGARGTIAQIPVGSNSAKLTPSHANILKGVSAVFGFAAALKNYAGTQSFMAQYNVSLVPSQLVSVFAALPSVCFYYDSAEKVSREGVMLWRARSVLPPQLQPYQIEFESAITHKFPKIESRSKTALWEYAVKLILGVGYGSANLGMVMDAFPSTFDYEGLKEFLLAALWFTNFSIGYDKMDTITNDIRRVFRERCEVPVFHADAEIVSAALKQFEELALEHEKDDPMGTFRSELRQAIKKELASMLSTREIASVLKSIETQMRRLQAKLHEPIQSNGERTVVTIMNDSEVNSNSPTHSDDFDVEAQQLLPKTPNDALDDPFYFRVLLPGEHPWAERGLMVFSVSLSALAISSNIGGIASLSFLQPLGAVLSYIIGGIGSLGAYSLNKGITDDWTQRFLATFQTNVLMATNKKQTSNSRYNPLASYQVIDYVGLAWSGAAATSGVYYTGSQIEKLLGTSTGATIFKYIAQTASAITTTFSKAIPTASLLRKMGSYCGSQKSSKQIKNQALRDFYNQQISLLLEKIIGLIEAYNHAVRNLSEMLQYRYGLDPTAFNYKTFIAVLNAKISREEIGRDYVYNELITHYDVIREKVMKAHAAGTIHRDASVGALR